jgi:hypothetical protein
VSRARHARRATRRHGIRVLVGLAFCPRKPRATPFLGSSFGSSFGPPFVAQRPLALPHHIAAAPSLPLKDLSENKKSKLSKDAGALGTISFSVTRVHNMDTKVRSCSAACIVRHRFAARFFRSYTQCRLSGKLQADALFFSFSLAHPGLPCRMCATSARRVRPAALAS